MNVRHCIKQSCDLTSNLRENRETYPMFVPTPISTGVTEMSPASTAASIPFLSVLPPLNNNSDIVLTVNNNDNITWNTTDDEGYVPYEDRPETYIVPTVFAVVFIVGLLGNGTLISIFMRHRTMRTIPNTYIMSLAVGDFILIAGTVPFISTIYTFDSWPYGEIICKLSEFFHDVSMGVTVLTLTMLSFDRYFAIVMPMKKYTGSHAKTVTILLAVGIWFVSIVLATPGAYYSFLWEVPVSKEKVIYVCYPFPEAMWPWYPRTMVLMKFLLMYGIPLIFIASFYVLMARHLIISSKNTVGKNPSHLRQLRSRTKVAKIVLAFVLIFAVCFFPSHVFLLWYYFHPNSNEHYNDFWHVCKIMGYILTFANSCLNPIALYFISGTFRDHFKRYLFCFCCDPPDTRQGTLTLRTVHSTTLKNHNNKSTIRNV